MSEKKKTQTRYGSQMPGRGTNSSYVQLIWNIEGLFDKALVLQKALESRLKEVPTKNTNERNKIAKWQKELNDINQKIEYVNKVKIDDLKKVLDYNFLNPDLLILSLIQPSLRNTFNELKIYFSVIGISPIKEEEFDDFINLGDATRVLAFIGDAAIDLALAQIFWQPKISKVKDMHDRRVNFASNKNLARICDKWNLYDCRIHLDLLSPPPLDDTISHSKGTIVEAIFGVMYIESGLEPIISSIRVLK